MAPSIEKPKNQKLLEYCNTAQNNTSPQRRRFKKINNDNNNNNNIFTP